MSLIVKRHHRFEDGSRLIAGDEVKPDSVGQAMINLLLDADILVEVPTRLSYFQLLPDFSGVEGSTERLDVGALFPALCVPRLKTSPKNCDTMQSS
jgi:hypothetical protein